MKKKPVSEIVSNNNLRRFPPLYVCYCPKCKKILSSNHDDKCSCDQEIDWSEFE